MTGGGRPGEVAGRCGEVFVIYRAIAVDYCGLYYYIRINSNGDSAMTAREEFIQTIEAGATVSSLAFTGWLSGFGAADKAWLRRQIKAGAIVEFCGGYPFNRPEYRVA